MIIAHSSAKIQKTLHVMPIEMRFNPQKPIEVVFRFKNSYIEPGAADSDWVFARDILISGMDDISGEGTITIWPSNEKYIGLYLSSPFGECSIEILRTDIITFLDLTLAAVPQENEHFFLEESLSVWINRHLKPVDGET